MLTAMLTPFRLLDPLAYTMPFLCKSIFVNLYKRRKISAQYHLFLARRLSGLLCSIQSPNIYIAKAAAHFGQHLTVGSLLVTDKDYKVWLFFLVCIGSGLATKAVTGVRPPVLDGTALPV